MSFVLDASITLAWCFSDETSPISIQTLEALDKETAVVPQIWPLEIGNILVAAEHKKRISYAKLTEFILLLNSLPILIDRETANRSLHEILSLAHQERLTTYDAAYLELAIRLGAPLASQDKLLCKAAHRLGVAVK